MAKILSYDPLTTEAQSPLIAGITEGLNKLSGLLNLNTGTLSDVELVEVYIDDEHRYRLYQAPLGQKLWLSTPAPVIKKNGAVISENTANFTIDYVGGSITFGSGSELTADDSITVSVTYIIEDSETLNNINTALETLRNTVEKYKGYYASEEALEDAFPTANSGDFAVVGGTTNSVFIWNITNEKWENTYKVTDLSNFYNKSNTNNLLNQKENTIQAHGETVLSDDYYYGGRKTWQELSPKVLDTLLTGLSTETGGNIASTDTILSALGKLQYQMGSYTHPIRANGEPTTSTVGVLGQEYINISNGDVFRCTSTKNGSYTWVSDMAYKVDGAKILDASVTTGKLVDGAVTNVKVANKAITRAKLADDAAYSPVATMTASQNFESGWAGRTIIGNSTSALTFTLTKAVSDTIPRSAEIAVLRWNTGTVKITLSGGIYLCNPSDETRTLNGSAAIGARYGMVALKKIADTDWLITGMTE